ncbi:MAG: DUF3300 domain-containing protein [Terriglobales bacterium]
MRPQTYLHASRYARFFRLSLDPPHDSSSEPDAIGGVVQGLRRLVALAMALLLLPLGQGELFAQQARPPGQAESQNDPYAGQYEPDQRSGDGQQPYAQPPYPASSQGYPQQGGGQAQPPPEPLNAERLEQLVAPIALYPDTLVAQVLAASTYPAQVADAAHWRLAQGYASPGQIAAGADAQNWDPSLKALTAFPQVLAEMDRNLQWTTDLGNAYYNQPQDVLQAVQVMRRRAQAAGNLQSTSQEAVSYEQGNIELAPVNPQLVYVPAYNPWSVYGQPVSPYPGFSLLDALGSFFGSSPIRYGLGIAMAAFSHTPWGWLAWGLNWLSQSVLFQHSNYYSQSTTVADWGFPHGGGYNSTFGQGFVPRPPSNYSRPGSGRNATLAQGFVPRPPDRYGRPGSGYNAARQGFVPRPPASYAANRLGESSNRVAYKGVRAGYGNRSTTAYRSPQRAYRARKDAFQRANFRGRSSGSSMGRSFARSSGKPPKSFHGGGHAPKFGGGRNFGGRHSGGGGHGGGRHHH